MAPETPSQGENSLQDPRKKGRNFSQPVVYTFNEKQIRTNIRTVRLIELFQRETGATHDECVEAMREEGEDDASPVMLNSRFSTAMARLKPFQDQGFKYGVTVKTSSKEYTYKAFDPNAPKEPPGEKASVSSPTTPTTNVPTPHDRPATGIDLETSYPRDFSERASWLAKQADDEAIMDAERIILKALLRSNPFQPTSLARILNEINADRTEKNKMKPDDFLYALRGVERTYGIKAQPIDVMVQTKDGNQKTAKRYYGKLT